MGYSVAFFLSFLICFFLINLVFIFNWDSKKNVLFFKTYCHVNLVLLQIMVEKTFESAIIYAFIYFLKVCLFLKI
jgi:hypothetical protein